MSADRAATILARFSAAHAALVGKLRELPPDTVEQSPAADAWSPAQIGYHVAITNDWVAAVLEGTAPPKAEPAPAGFMEAFNPKAIPARLKTFPTLEPPKMVSCEVALDKLRASGHRVSKAMASLTAERGSGYCVTLPFGTLSLFELADFTTGHVIRHIGQIERTVAHV
jgi:DinB family protein